jgi:CRISPR/Cas system endoribonuclease Cas6 (RAMP superfamily)
MINKVAEVIGIKINYIYFFLNFIYKGLRKTDKQLCIEVHESMYESFFFLLY